MEQKKQCAEIMGYKYSVVYYLGIRTMTKGY